MKKFVYVFIIILAQSFMFCEADEIQSVKVFSQNNKYYGLSDKDGKEIVPAKYKKFIKLGDSAWIIQKKNNKFGLMDNSGNILVPAKYLHAERLFDKWVKLGNDKDFGLYDEFGQAIVPAEFRAIEPLFGGKFLTYKNYKYGMYSNTGKKLLDNEFEFIYMPTPKVLRIKKGNEWYEVEKITEAEAIKLPESEVKKVNNEHFRVTQIFINTGVGASYSVLTATDYVLKLFSTISTAYEDTIDELMLSQGVDTVSNFMKLSWIPKFPIVYAKKYGINFIHPNNGPLSDIRSELKEQMD